MRATSKYSSLDHDHINNTAILTSQFQFILTSSLAKKPTLNTAPSQLRDTNRTGSDINTTGFEINALNTHTHTHYVAANKFCYARPHLMLLTSDGHRRQTEPLDKTDLASAWQMLNLAPAEGDYVAFFNCGQEAGCSRLHKHLQVMPLPAGTFAAFLDSEASGLEPRVPFEWLYRRVDSGCEMSSDSLVGVYEMLLREATRVAGCAESGVVCPHNMIMTRRWMIVVPRRRGAINKEAGANSLGMLGVIAVATMKEVDAWVRLGLTKSLAELGVPRNSP